MERTIVIRLMLALAIIGGGAAAAPRASAAGVCDIVGNSQNIYDLNDAAVGLITVADCVENVGNYGDFGMPDPEPGYIYLVLEIVYDAGALYYAVPYWIYVSNCNGYLSAPDATFMDSDPYDGYGDWQFMPSTQYYELSPGESVSALIFYQLSANAHVAHVYFLNVTGTEMQLLDLSLDGGFAANAAGPAPLSYAIPSAKLRACRAD